MLNMIHVKSTTLCPVVGTFSFCSIVNKSCIYKFKTWSLNSTIYSNINTSTITIGGYIEIEFAVISIHESSNSTTIWGFIFNKSTVDYSHLSHTRPKCSTTIRNLRWIACKNNLCSVIDECGIINFPSLPSKVFNSSPTNWDSIVYEGRICNNTVVCTA